MYISIPFNHTRVPGVVVAYKSEFRKYHALVALSIQNISLLKAIIHKSSYIKIDNLHYVTLFNEKKAKSHNPFISKLFQEKISLLNKFSYILFMHISIEIIPDPFVDLYFDVIGISNYQNDFFSTNLQDNLRSITISPGKFDYSFAKKTKINNDIPINSAEISNSYAESSIETLLSHFKYIKKISLEVPFLIDLNWNLFCIYKKTNRHSLPSIKNVDFPSTPTAEDINNVIQILKLKNISHITIRFKFYLINQNEYNINLDISQHMEINLDNAIQNIIDNIQLTNLNQNHFFHRFKEFISHYINQSLADQYLIADMSIYYQDFIDITLDLMEKYCNLFIESYHLKGICIYHSLILKNNFIYWSGVENNYDNEFIYQFLLDLSIHFNKNIVISSLRSNENLYYLYYHQNNIDKLEKNFKFWNSIHFIEYINLYSWIAAHIPYIYSSETDDSLNLWKMTSALNDKIIFSKTRDFFFVYFLEKSTKIFGFENNTDNIVKNIEEIEDKVKSLYKDAIIIENDTLYIFEIAFLASYYFKLSKEHQTLLNKFVVLKEYLYNNQLFIQYTITSFEEIKLNNYLNVKKNFIKSVANLKFSYLISSNKYLFSFEKKIYVQQSKSRFIYLQNAKISNRQITDAQDYFVSVDTYHSEYIYIYSKLLKKIIFGFFLQTYENKYIYVMLNVININDCIIDILHNDFILIDSQTKLNVIK